MEWPCVCSLAVQTKKCSLRYSQTWMIFGLGSQGNPLAIGFHSGLSIALWFRSSKHKNIRNFIRSPQVLRFTFTPHLPISSLPLQKAAFQDANVCLFVFDCIYFNDVSLMDRWGSVSVPGWGNVGDWVGEERKELAHRSLCQVGAAQRVVVNGTITSQLPFWCGSFFCLFSMCVLFFFLNIFI